MAPASYYYHTTPDSAENLFYQRLLDEEYTRHPLYGSSGKCVTGSRNHWKCDLSENPVRKCALRKASERPSSTPSKQSRYEPGFPIGRCRKAS
jgi:hypothetical protein